MVIHPPFPLWIVIAVLLVVLVASLYFAWSSTRQCALLTRGLVLLCRAAAACGLLLIALNPGHWIEEQETDESYWTILVDRSPSMLTSDGTGQQTRFAQATGIVNDIDKLLSDEQLAVFPFADQLDAKTNGDIGVDESVERTDLLGAIDATIERESGRGSMRGIIVVSDGRQTGEVSRRKLEQTVLRARAQRSPIYAIPLGQKVAVHDLKVTAQRRQHLGFPDEPVRVTVKVSKQGLGALRPIVHLLDDNDEPIDQQPVELAEGNDSAVAAFEVRELAAGVHSYAFKVDAIPGEHRIDNNTSRFSVIALKERTRVLTVEGVPYWDSKFLAQLLRNRKNMDVTSIYRVSSKRFFKVKSELSQAEESEEVLFPSTSAEMNQYDLLVLGKGMEYFLDDLRLELLRDFVTSQGGTVLFSRGKPYHGKFPAIDDFEPVAWGDPIEQSFKLQPTLEGVREGIFGELLPGPDDGVWDSLPLLSDSNRIARLKPFSKVLVNGVIATSGTESEFPVLIARRLGKGLVLTINADGLWKWDFFPEAQQEGGRNMYQETWTQLIYWSATFSEFLPGQDYAIQLSKELVDVADPIRATVNYRGPIEQRPESLKLAVRDAAGNTAQQTLLIESGQNRRSWEGTLTVKDPGHYRVQIDGADSAVRELLTVAAPPHERDELSVDREFLGELCELSGGHLLEASEIPEVLSNTSRASETPPEDRGNITFDPVWDSAWWLIGLLGLLAFDWYLRRRAGLL